MDGWIIITKLIILIYGALEFFSGDLQDSSVVLLLILFNISLNMLFYIFKHKWLKKALLIASALFIVFSADYTTTLFLFLLPMIGAELAGMYTDHPIPAVIVAALVVPAVESDRIEEYIISAALSLLVYFLSYKAYNRIKTLSEENDGLREKNDNLFRKVEMEQDYENQIRYLSQMEERNSLSQKIHDKVGHTIAGSLIQLEAAAMLMDRAKEGCVEKSEELEKSRQMVGNVTRALTDGMEDIRSTLRSIKPAPEQLGINRLKILVDEFSVNCPIKSELKYKGNISSISHLHWKVIIDNVKEALTNAMKYSKANNISVGLEVMNRLVKVEIRDDGVGAITYKKSLGIRGMEERTESAGGKLVLDGSKGFSVIMLLPFHDARTGELAAGNKGGA